MPRRETACASGLVARQPRKPEAALVMDWFYALPPLIDSSWERGSRFTLFEKRAWKAINCQPPVPNMRLYLGLVNVEENTNLRLQ